MTELEPTTLNFMIAGRTTWTRELTQDVRLFFTENVGDDFLNAMHELLHGEHHLTETPTSMWSDFMRYPPTVLLGAFDRVRWGEAVLCMVDDALSK